MVVDDHPMWRQTLRKVLERGRVGRIVAEAGDGEEAIRHAQEFQPNVVIMDLGLPHMDGIEAIGRLVGILPTTRVLVLSASDERADVVKAMRAGASGYLLKTADPTEVVDAVRRIHRGEAVLPTGLADVILDELRAGSEGEAAGIRLVVGNASPLFREGLARILGERGFQVVETVGETEALIGCVSRELPDVVLTDVRPPTESSSTSPDIGSEIKRKHPEVGVLVLADDIDITAASLLVGKAAGGVGYLLKDRVSDAVQLAEAIIRVAKGESVLDPEVAARLVGPREKRDPLGELTPREREVLALMAEGRSNQAISAGLFLSAKAVEGHVRNIFMKLGLEQAPDDHRRVLAVLAYLRSL